MNATLNKHRLNNLIRGIQTSVALFESQGHENVYFTAHFYRGGRKQNSIERGDIQSFAKQLRTYISSEEAESARVEFFNEQSGKSIYVKVMSELRLREQVANDTAPQQQQHGLGAYAGLGEAQVNQVVDRRVAELRKADEFERLGKEVEELRAKNERLLDQNDELEATIKAKSQIEFYTGIIGAAFPGLATLLTGTPLAQAANFLAGTSAGADTSLPGPADEPRDSDSISDLIGEFCATLNKQELAAIHLLFVAFESDRTKIQTALQVVSAAASTATAA